MQKPQRTAAQTLRRDLNTEYLALARVTREALELHAGRIVAVEQRADGLRDWCVGLSVACGLLLLCIAGIALLALV